MKVLVLQESYPSDENPYAQAWAHTRNLFYISSGVDLRVVVFKKGTFREFEGVKVFSHDSFEEIYEWADIVLCHQPNIKFHLRHLFFYRSKPMVFFIHGHEVMKLNEDYSKDFFYVRQRSQLHAFLRKFYDPFKIFLLRNFIKLCGRKLTSFIFVSDWMKRVFYDNLNFDLDINRFRYAVIPNPVSGVFLKRKYSMKSQLLADFITIRNWDMSKHAVDLVLEAAQANPSKTFHIYGHGELPKYVDVPSNVSFISKYFLPEEMPDLLDQYQAFLIPTRVDSQGVMACEAACYGIPVITSDISVAREFLGGFPNVKLIENSSWFSSMEIPEIGNVDEKLVNSLSIEKLASKELRFFEYVLKCKLID